LGSGGRGIENTIVGHGSGNVKLHIGEAAGVLVGRLVVVPESDKILLVKGDLAVGAQIVLNIALTIANGELQRTLGDDMVSLGLGVSPSNGVFRGHSAAAHGSKGQRGIIHRHPAAAAGEGADILALDDVKLNIRAVSSTQGVHQRVPAGGIGAIVLV